MPGTTDGHFHWNLAVAWPYPKSVDNGRTLSTLWQLWENMFSRFGYTIVNVTRI
jgi:hypothetical protein